MSFASLIPKYVLYALICSPIFDIDVIKTKALCMKKEKCGIYAGISSENLHSNLYIMQTIHSNKFAAEIFFVYHRATCYKSGASITFYVTGMKIRMATH